MISSESPEDTHERYEKRPSHLPETIRGVGAQAIKSELLPTEEQASKQPDNSSI